MTWLPRRTLTRNEAITAMTIAETTAEVLADEPGGSSARLWPHVEGWAAELGIDAVDAVALASLPPAWHRPAPRVRVILPEPGPVGELLDSDPATGRAVVRIDGQIVVMDACRLADA